MTTYDTSSNDDILIEYDSEVIQIEQGQIDTYGRREEPDDIVVIKTLTNVNIFGNDITHLFETGTRFSDTQLDEYLEKRFTEILGGLK